MCVVISQLPLNVRDFVYFIKFCFPGREFLIRINEQLSPTLPTLCMFTSTPANLSGFPTKSNVLRLVWCPQFLAGSFGGQHAKFSGVTGDTRGVGQAKDCMPILACAQSFDIMG